MGVVGGGGGGAGGCHTIFASVGVNSMNAMRAARWAEGVPGVQVRAMLSSGLASGLRNDAPEGSLAMRQRWRLAEGRAQDYAFVLLSRLTNLLEAQALTAAPRTPGRTHPRLCILPQWVVSGASDPCSTASRSIVWPVVPALLPGSLCKAARFSALHMNIV